MFKDSSGEIMTGTADLINAGLGIYNTFFNGPSDTAQSDVRFMNDFAWKQQLRQEDFQRNYLQYRAQDAAAAGFHPLTALGINPGSGPGGMAFQTPDANARRKDFSMMANLGQNTMRALSRQMTPFDQMKGLAELDYMGSQSELNRAQADHLRAEILNMSKDKSVVDDLFVPVRGPSGNIQMILNPKYANSFNSMPLQMWGNSIENAFAGPDTKVFWKETWKAGKAGAESGYEFAIPAD